MNLKAAHLEKLSLILDKLIKWYNLFSIDFADDQFHMIISFLSSTINCEDNDMVHKVSSTELNTEDFSIQSLSSENIHPESKEVEVEDMKDMTYDVMKVSKRFTLLKGSKSKFPVVKRLKSFFRHYESHYDHIEKFQQELTDIIYP